MEYVSQKALQKAEHIAERYKHQLEKAKELGKKTTQVALRTGAAAGTTFALAYWEGKAVSEGKPEKSQVMGMDLSLLVGAAGLVVEAMELGGDEMTNELAGSAGIGALCAFAYKKGHLKGTQIAA